MNLSKNCLQLRGLDFSKTEIEKCIKNNRILRLSLALSKKCNLQCLYCYAVERYPETELTQNEIKDVIIQAKNNGAKTITLTGGEPLIYHEIKEVISFINSNNLITIFFTNGTVMNQEFARFLFNHNASLIVKLNSFDDYKLHDELVGKEDSFDKVNKTLSILIKTGFNKSNPTRLGVESIICRKNLSQIPKIFRFARGSNIYPYLELVTPSGKGKNYSGVLRKEEAKEIFIKLLKIDESEFGYTWIPRPPQIANTCKFYFTAIYIDSNGKVYPCPTVDIELGDIKNEGLSRILKKPKTRKIRAVRENIKGKCKICNYHSDCYGCRGATFNLTGDIFNEDPICWI